MNCPNPLSPFLMSPAERRAELCRILALGLIRLHARQSSERSDGTGESSPLSARAEWSCNSNASENRMTNHDPIPARLAQLKTTSTLGLKAQWRDLFETEPPPFNRRYLESRLSYRIQELTYGGLKPETIRRLERLGEELDGGDRQKRSIRADRDRPITGTRLLREWQGVEQIVTVTANGFEWQGRPYRLLSAIARVITGTRWNGWVFFGLENHRRRT